MLIRVDENLLSKSTSPADARSIWRRSYYSWRFHFVLNFVQIWRLQCIRNCWVSWEDRNVWYTEGWRCCEKPMEQQINDDASDIKGSENVSTPCMHGGRLCHLQCVGAQGFCQRLIVIRYKVWDMDMNVKSREFTIVNYQAGLHVTMASSCFNQSIGPNH